MTTLHTRKLETTPSIAINEQTPSTVNNNNEELPLIVNNNNEETPSIANNSNSNNENNNNEGMPIESSSSEPPSIFIYFIYLRFIKYLLPIDFE